MGVIVGQSKTIAGELGVIATCVFKSNELIFKVSGPMIRTRTKYSFQFGPNEHIEPIENGALGFGHYLNHSCIPNAFIQIVEDTNDRHIKILARRQIKIGEEVRIDYATMEYDITISEAKCLCGTTKCRGKITGFKKLKRKVKQKYIDEGIIPEYLIRLGQKPKSKL